MNYYLKLNFYEKRLLKKLYSQRYSRSLFFIIVVLSTLSLLSCGEKSNQPWEFEKPPLAGNILPVTRENITGTWNIAGLYSEQKDMTGVNPSLRTGYLILRDDDSCFFQLNKKTESPLLKGIYNTTDITEKVVTLEMTDENDVKLPKVKMTINELTDRQMDVDYLYYDPGYGKGESNDSIRMLADFNFDNGSLLPDYFPEDILVSGIELVGITAAQQNDTTMSFTGFLNNVNNQNSKNLHFKLLSISEEKLAVDSFYIEGYRLPEILNNSKIQFCTSNKTVNDFVNNGNASYDFPKDGSQSAVTMPAASTALGDSLYVGVTANIPGTNNNGTLYINRLSVYGRLILGEKFLYNYVFEKQQ